ncbi:hypothetical protein BJ994_003055 [Arthrobacter pigmenti]|uniref:Uncharacterized protein n=1 Tax=Arthrobacter pigmenti TaxID=271432 RepID=A0A846RSE4_9MICC|nr:hypothetical protein [Arthrobacter pigmenti]NJC23979.1 hypothetical protein [Arthrobacter pigmenti]
MNITGWWPRLDQATRDWLIAHNGEAVPASVLEKISAVGAAPDGTQEDDGFYFADHVVDWIEAVANDEEPG